MSEWKAWCRGLDDITVRGDDAEVRLADGRSHRVSVESTRQGWRLQARVATRGTLASVDQPELLTWQRNRTTQLVGFRIDKNDLLVGAAWVPEPGITPDEFRLYVRTIAIECDRLEALLTGVDVE